MPSRRIPPDQRKRTEMSCDKCKARKQKCHRPLAPPLLPPSARALTLSSSSASSSSPAAARDDACPGLPCRYCQTHNHVCVTTQPRKRRGTYYAPGVAPPGPDAAARVVLLEGLVKGLMPDADTASVDGLRALGRALGVPLPDTADDGTMVTAEDAPADDDDDQVATAADDDFDADQGDGLAKTFRQEVADAAAAGPENGLPDCAGQTQYVGANSSYAMQLRVRALLMGVDNSSARFFLFAGAPPSSPQVGVSSGLPAHPAHVHGGTDDDPGLLFLCDAGADYATPTDAEALADPVADALLAAYFARVHPSFPVLDEAAFRAAYTSFLGQDGAGVDPAWLCSLYCVFLLARPFVPPERAPGVAEDASASWWWHRVRGLLPAVLMASRPAAVGALLLAAAHLNHTNRRDACWTLTGAAVRIAVAVGLHRFPPPPPSAASPVDIDDDAPRCATRHPNHLEVLWGTLCRFERLQAASLDRPSALEEEEAAVIPAPVPASYDRALSILLARAARIARTTRGPDFSSKTPAAVARLLRDLAHWRAALTPNMRRPDDDDTSRAWPSPDSRGAVLRLHVEHQHVLCVAARGALLRRCRADGVGRQSSAGPPEDDLAAVAVRAARDSLSLLLALADPLEEGEAAALDPYTGWDLYFLYQAVLVLGLHIALNRGGADPDVALLGRAARVAVRIEADPCVPGTMRRYSVVIREVDAFVQQRKQQQTKTPHHGGGLKWSIPANEPVAPYEPEGGGAAATLMPPPPPSHEDMMGVMSQVSFPPPPSPELAAQFGLVDSGFWMGPREGWGDFMGFGA